MPTAAAILPYTLFAVASTKPISVTPITVAASADATPTISPATCTSTSVAAAACRSSVRVNGHPH